MKVCSKCKKNLMLKLFGCNQAKPDGLQSWCKKCRAAYQEEYQQTTEGKLSNRKKQQRYQRTGKGKIVNRENSRKQRIFSPEKTRARNAVAYAIKTGKLTRPEHCSVCGKKCKPEAHHEDYSKPLEVQWLCGDTCHPEADARIVKRGI